MFRFLLTVLYALALSKSVQADSSCIAAGVALRVLGSGGPELDDGRASSSYLLTREGKAAVLVDAGGGSVQNFERAGARIETLAALLLTHLHVDHSAEVPVYLKASYFTPRDRDLAVLGPAGNKLMPSTSAFVQALFAQQGAYPYLSSYLDGGGVSAFKLKVMDAPVQGSAVSRWVLDEGLVVSSVPVHHGPVAAVAWRVDIDGCAITFSGDMSHHYGNLPQLARGSDLLVLHNALPEGATGAAVNLHMLPSEIGAIAGAASPAGVLLSHRMNRSLGREEETLRLIRENYRGPILFAEDMQVVALGEGSGNQVGGPSGQ